MNNFKVTEIIDANTIRVQPSWAFVDESGKEITDNRITITGIKSEANDPYTKHILYALLMDKEVELVNPRILAFDKHQKPILSCNVLIGKTDITYYFAQPSSKEKKEFAYH
jgi:hypothetical protein